MIRAVLFDLDGTLLDIDIDSFLREYFSALGPVLAQLAGTADPAVAIRAILASTDTMCEPHAGRTNRDVFHERFRALTGVDLDEPETAGAVRRFYAEVFPTLQRTHGPRPGGSAAVGAAREAGLAVALATNPIFPRAAIDERMRWAEPATGVVRRRDVVREHARVQTGVRLLRSDSGLAWSASR